jgi:translocator protein
MPRYFFNVYDGSSSRDPLAAILAFIATAWRQDRVAAWLFVPYAAWVAFASVLNGSIWALN